MSSRQKGRNALWSAASSIQDGILQVLLPVKKNVFGGSSSQDSRLGLCRTTTTTVLRLGKGQKFTLNIARASWRVCVCVCAYVSVRESEAHQTVCVTVSFFLFTLFGPELRNILSRLEKNGGGGDV